jgi:chromosome segregation ATPase
MSKVKIKDLKEELDDSDKKLRSTEQDRLKIAQKHEEALSKLKEAKEVILNREDEFNKYKSNFQEDFSKLSAMEGEIKTYRIKLGELNKEKEGLMAKYESECHSREEEKKKLNEGFKKDLDAQKKKIAGMQQDFEDETEKRERLHERRISEIKTQTKDAISKLTMEKDREFADLKIENEKLRKQIEKLKDEIRVLEIEKL